MRTATLITFAMVLGLMAVPLSSATVLNATINTQTNTGYVNATSNFALVLTYPQNSSMSKELNGTVIWYNATAYINASYTREIGADMNHASEANNSTSNGTGSQSTVRVVNATITYQLHTYANQTTLKVFRNLTLYLKITGITKTVGNRTIIDMSWRSFEVQGQLMSDLHGHFMLKNPNLGVSISNNISMNADVNELGDLSFGNFGGMGEGMDLGDIFEGAGFHSDFNGYATINFHVFQLPLTKWVKSYNPSTNTTTFYHNTSLSVLLDESVNYDGAGYTLKVTADPSSSITVPGYAKPTSSSELAIYASPPAAMSTMSLLLVAVGLIVVIALVVAAMMMRKNKR